MGELDDLLERVRTALDPERFLNELGASVQGRPFLSGEIETVALTRSFLDSEADIARYALEALEEIRRRVDVRP